MNRGSRWISLASAGVVATVGLTGCVDGEEPAPSGTPRPTPAITEPMSDEELLADAATIVEQYTLLLSETFATGEVPGEMFDIASASVTSQAQADALELAELGYAMSGQIIVTEPELVDREDGSTGIVALLLACFDTSETELVDAAGAPVERGGVSQRVVQFSIAWSSQAHIEEAVYPSQPSVEEVCGSS